MSKLINFLKDLKLISKLPANITDNVIKATGEQHIYVAQNFYRGLFSIVKVVTPIIEDTIQQYKVDQNKIDTEIERIKAIIKAEEKIETKSEDKSE